MRTKDIVYIGTYTEPILFGTGQVLQGKGKGIYAYEFDRNDGSLEFLGVAEGVVNPSFIAIGNDGTTVYAVNELKMYDGQPTGTVSAFRIGARPSVLEFLNLRATMGTDPCHLALDKSGAYVAVANFRTGSVSVYPILQDGSLGEKSAFVQHSGSSVDPMRQAGPHAHAVVFDPSNRYMLVPDLGLDKVMVYVFDAHTGALSFDEERTVNIAAGSGPRYLEYHPSGKFVYLVNELSSTVTVLKIDASGFMEEIQTISTLPDGYEGSSTCADLHVLPSGKFLYASNRGHDSLAIFGIDQRTGTLVRKGIVSTKGRTPRNFAVDPSGRFVLAANQDTDNIVVFEVDHADGMLRANGVEISVPTPVCVRFLARQ